MEKQFFNYNLDDLDISAVQIGQLMGSNDDQSKDSLTDIIIGVLKEATDICRIRGEYVIYNGVGFIDDQKTIKISDQYFNVKKTVFNQLKGAESIAIFLCTAGSGPGTRASELMAAGDPLTAYIYDIIASAIVDAAAEKMQKSLEAVVNAAGLKITNRYNPGYCGWDVAEQHKLFRLVPDNYCGIRLTGSALMDPVKSASGFIGIGSDVKYNPYTCELCGMTDCNYRKVSGSVIL